MNKISATKSKSAKSGSWWSRITDYIRFIQARRRDYSSSLAGKSQTWYLVLVSWIAISILLVLFVDQHYLNYIRGSEWKIYLIFEYITQFGKIWWVLVITAAVMVIMSFLHARRFTGNALVVWHRIFLNAFFIFTAVGLSGLLALAAKNLIGRARPHFTPIEDIWFAIPLGDNYEFASFPSGHSTTGGAIAMALALLFPRWRWFFLFAGFWIAFSRPALGVHFPSDAFAGFMLGCIFVYYYARGFARMRLLFRFNTNGGLALRGERVETKGANNIPRISE